MLVWNSDERRHSIHYDGHFGWHTFQPFNYSALKKRYPERAFNDQSTNHFCWPGNHLTSVVPMPLVIEFSSTGLESYQENLRRAFTSIAGSGWCPDIVKSRCGIARTTYLPVAVRKESPPLSPSSFVALHLLATDICLLLAIDSFLPFLPLCSVFCIMSHINFLDIHSHVLL